MVNKIGDIRRGTHFLEDDKSREDNTIGSGRGASCAVLEARKLKADLTEDWLLLIEIAKKK